MDIYDFYAKGHYLPFYIQKDEFPVNNSGDVFYQLA